MDIRKENIMDKKDFLSNGIYDKESYEGLLISARPDGLMQIGIQLEQDKVLKVDEVPGDRVRERLEHWAPEIIPTQKAWKAKNSLDHFDVLDMTPGFFGRVDWDRDKGKSSQDHSIWDMTPGYFGRIDRDKEKDL